MYNNNMSVVYIDYPMDYVVFRDIKLMGGVVLLEILSDGVLIGKIYENKDGCYLVNYLMENYLKNNIIITKLEENNVMRFNELKIISLKEWFKMLVREREEIVKTFSY
jgi:hypothetical protein